MTPLSRIVSNEQTQRLGFWGVPEDRGVCLYPGFCSPVAHKELPHPPSNSPVGTLLSPLAPTAPLTPSCWHLGAISPDVPHFLLECLISPFPGPCGAAFPPAVSSGFHFWGSFSYKGCWKRSVPFPALWPAELRVPGLSRAHSQSPVLVENSAFLVTDHFNIQHLGRDQL